MANDYYGPDWANELRRFWNTQMSENWTIRSGNWYNRLWNEFEETTPRTLHADLEQEWNSEHHHGMPFENMATDHIKTVIRMYEKEADTELLQEELRLRRYEF